MNQRSRRRAARIITGVLAALLLGLVWVTGVQPQARVEGLKFEVRPNSHAMYTAISEQTQRVVYGQARWLEIERLTTRVGRQPPSLSRSYNVHWGRAILLLLVYGSLITGLAWVHCVLMRWAVSPLGHCHACGYNLTGVQSDSCPECGEPISKQAQPT